MSDRKVLLQVPDGKSLFVGIVQRPDNLLSLSVHTCHTPAEFALAMRELGLNLLLCEDLVSLIYQSGLHPLEKYLVDSQTQIQ